jgi:DNA-binding beta-propeller fold protein YncE
MAGSHQIWRFDPRTDEIRPLAGTGMEALTDGALGDAAFAQPSGLWRAGAVLYVADSESSAVRAIDLARGVVSTLVGTGLFDFGLVDGYGVQARLQHPLDVVGAGSRLYIADSFNNRIRLLDTTDRNRVTTLAVTGVTPFKEPSGLSIDGNLLYVADTNNHRVVVIDLSTNRAKVLSLSGAAR